MFKLFKKNNATIPVIKEVPAAAATYKVGQVLYTNAGGYVAGAAGSTAPEYVCATDATVATSGMKIAVNPIYEDMEFKTVFSADGSALVKGQKVTVSTTFDSVTATTTNGVATIVEKIGTGASGTEVIVKF